MPSWLTRDNKTNWEKYRDTPEEQTVRYRDPHSEQQLEHTPQQRMQTPFTRQVAVVAFTILFAFIVWTVISFVEMMASAHSVANIINLRGSGISLPAYMRPTIVKVLITTVLDVAFFAIAYTFAMRNLEAQNAPLDNAALNSHTNDGHIMLREELQEMFDWFPDAGAHSSVQVISMISHMALANKGLGKIDVVEWGSNEDEDAEFYAAIEGDEEELSIVRKPWIDEEFQDKLFEVSGAPKRFRKPYDATRIPYNPGNANRDKLKGFETVADLINGDWEMPMYERQRPGGAYIVDTAPINTMVLAITRAGKGQTVIEPTIDMWTRQKNPANVVINDPKGELLVKFYVPATVRGFQIVQLNLINSVKTDICNPLALAVQSAREGDTMHCAQYIDNIAKIFFPVDGGEDPVWPNAANNAFKRAAYGLIDYYMEEERQLRHRALKENWDAAKLDVEIDHLWGHVTLYNCYQLFVQLTAKKRKNPYQTLKAELAAQGKKEAKGDDKAALEAARQDPMNRLWDESATGELDELSLFFAATEMMPSNSVRRLVNDANNALKSMGAAEKMLASVYGIAVTAMAYFADPTIMRLTSGTPSQNVDLAGFSFPRRIAVRLHPDYCERHHLYGLALHWEAYADAEYTQSLGKDFTHDDVVSTEGWCRFFFKGIFPENKAYIKLEFLNAMTNVLVKTMYFSFEKSYRVSLDGRTYVKDPVLDSKIVLNGVLRERLRQKDGTFVDGVATFKRNSLEYVPGGESANVAEIDTAVITNSLVRYSEKPKVMFMITPPHLMNYAKLLLIILKNLVDLNFDQSYMTKSNQKPLYATNYMLDEVGNLQSDGNGIANLETMLSIGLGQSQFFTLILQTLQQLRNVYGEDSDKIIQGNAQPFDSLIATPNGWKRMGDVAVGDDVLTPKGAVTQVIGVYPRGKRMVYRITRRDGASCLACGEHLWKVRLRKS